MIFFKKWFKKIKSMFSDNKEKDLPFIDNKFVLDPKSEIVQAMHKHKSNSADKYSTESFMQDYANNNNK
ncbi:hypothetical protein fh0823_24050 [Francisella halioticida]|uniref:hypothetical protein n=1 Tax=Francisella halioticida TaxID=549298 RepID=UPI001AFA431F|nr:hypothetical protein [Francisella halioticida]BCD92266.1 hypothetical protein fh0823_24050 [Francisella halioticida]